mmetsp:Transcript_83064/g.211420  ORF Transcript_83064/g.211420 Transcript_83064/m.211420 type:complete len:176 (+) Transcript_83064:104-631(+)
MVALSMTRVLTGFALVGAAWATASPPAADVAAAEAMNADDECAAAAGGAGCAVNAMQMRALKKEEAPAVQPLYCMMLPAGISSPFCSPGVTTCGCQAYCATASPTSFGWDPNCCSCTGITAAPPRAPASIAPAAGGSCAAYGCSGAYTAAHTCQCNSQCAAHNNCCGDYTSKCGR